MSIGHREFISKNRRTRAKLTNGSLLPRGLDGRSAPARRYRDLILQFSHGIAGERGAPLNPAELALVKQAAAITVRAEALQAAIVRGEPVSDEDVVRLSNSAIRILTAVMNRSIAPKKKGPPSDPGPNAGPVPWINSSMTAKEAAAAYERAIKSMPPTEFEESARKVTDEF
jgi:hypothetical protein